MASKSTKSINIKRKIVAQGLFESELKEILSDKLIDEGFAGVRIRNKASKKEIVIYATRTQNVLGENGRLFNEISSLLKQRFNLDNKDFELYVDRVANRGLCAPAQAESLKYKLAEGVKARRAALSVMKFIMMNEANGVEIDISGKLRGARGKTVKFKSGYMVKSGSAKEDFVVESIRHVNMRQGVLGIKLRIQLPSGGERGELPDVVKVKKPMELVEDEGEIEVKQPMQRKVIIPRNRRSARDIDTNPLIPQNQ